MPSTRKLDAPCSAHFPAHRPPLWVSPHLTRNAMRSACTHTCATVHDQLHTLPAVTAILLTLITLILSLFWVSACQCAQDTSREPAIDTVKSITAIRINQGQGTEGDAGGAVGAGAAEGTAGSAGVLGAAGGVHGGGLGTGPAISSPPKIDGVLNEDFWQLAERSSGFVQYQPDEGKAASESTFVRVAYDDDAVYIGLEMYDSEPHKIANRLTRRDRPIEADLMNIIIDSHHDHQTAYAFVVYASGTQRDVYYYNDVSSDDTWDGVWESATQLNYRGWTAEAKIPFHCLRFASENASGSNSVWGIYFSRNISRKGELDRWVRIPESAGGFVSRFGHLKGLNGLHLRRRLEILPYGVSYAQIEPKNPGNEDGRRYTNTAGFDAKYGLSSNITLNATINPDFGQVEADQTILNLSTFETWYPEKRPFFLEGSKIFETYYSLFYSRRIGIAPSLSPRDVAYYIDRPTATTILGAAKISGKTSRGTSIGILESATQEERATYVDFGGNRKTAVIEPTANYLVARVMQDIRGNSSIGVMGTAVNQKNTDPQYAGGADCILRFHNNDYWFMGQAVGSRTAAREIMGEAPSSETAGYKSGYGGVIYGEKSGGEHIRGSARLEYRDRALDLNRLGYLERPDIKEASGWFQYKTTGKRWIVRKTWNNLNVAKTDNLSGVRLIAGGNVNSTIEFTNLWTLNVGGWQDYQTTFADFETRGGPPAPIPIGRSWWFEVGTDARKKWQTYVHVEGGDSWDGHFNYYALSLDFRPATNVELSLAPTYRGHWAASRWLTFLTDTEGRRTDDIFGEQSLHRLDMTLRGTFTFSKNLTLQAYAQPFFAAVDYKHFKKLIPPDKFEYVDSSVYNEAEQRPDFNLTSFNSNLILRWEYRPGSALYLVWTQSRGSMRSIGDFRLSRDWDSLFDAPANNTLLLKVSYWWSI